jgi:hypothetical protein
MNDVPPTAPDHAATLRAWRERGADRVHPVRFSFLEALMRRAAAQSGAARQLLDEKIAGLMASYGEDLARAPEPAQAPARASANAAARAPASAPAPALAPVSHGAPSRAHAPAPSRKSAHAPTPAPAHPPVPRGPLGTLADLINRQRTPAAAAPACAAPTGPSPTPTFPSELKALDDVRNTWARLDAEQRLDQALAQVPTNAGPLNSYHLVLRTLTLMRDVSPEYLQRFMSHVDALMWLERTAP